MTGIALLIGLRADTRPHFFKFSSSHEAGHHTPFRKRTHAPRMRGVTIDDIQNLDQILPALQRLNQRMTARVVFDEHMPPAEYLDAVKQIHAVANVSGLVVDSHVLPIYTVGQYRARVQDYLNVLGPYVDIWEIGNEINGEWTGEPADVAEKVTAAYDMVKARKGVVAVTFYYNKGCADTPDHEMYHWISAHLPKRVRRGSDYVFLSYYEDECNHQQPDWNNVFNQVANLFPNSKVGFGEIGTENPQEKEEFVQRYYTMAIQQPSFVGGYFWWYFDQDMVPSSRPLWHVLRNALAMQDDDDTSDT